MEVFMNRFIRSFFFILAGLIVQTNLSAAAAAAAANPANFDAHAGGFYLGPGEGEADPAYVFAHCTHCHRGITIWQSMRSCHRCAPDPAAHLNLGRDHRVVHRGCYYRHPAVAVAGGAGVVPVVGGAALVDTDARTVSQITTLIENDPEQLFVKGRDSILVQGIKLMAQTIEDPTAGEEEIWNIYQMIVNPAVAVLLPHHDERSELAIAYLDYFITKVGQETDLEGGDDDAQARKCRRWHWILTLVDATAKDIMIEKKKEAERLRAAGVAAGAAGAASDARSVEAAAAVATRTDAGAASLFATLTASVVRRPAVMGAFPAAFLTASTRVAGCAICMSMHRPADRKVAKLECGHIFHANPDCIVTWIAGHSTCPICRAPISETKKADLRALSGS